MVCFDAPGALRREHAPGFETRTVHDAATHAMAWLGSALAQHWTLDDQARNRVFPGVQPVREQLVALHRATS